MSGRQPEESEKTAAIRLDKWLWQARFFKSRSLAAAEVSAGHVRVDGQQTVKPARTVLPGMVLTFTQGERVRVVRILAPGHRRGPAAEAQALYEDLSPPQTDIPPNPAYEGKGRPSGRDRRAMMTHRRAAGSFPLE